MSVYLIGAGPGTPDLLTLRAARLLNDADVVVHDRLIDPQVLAMANPLAQMIDAGKGPNEAGSQSAINELLVSLGRSRRSVVRLKGGDPFVFGRGGEEFEALQRAGVTCEVVPGVTSAFAAPLLAGIPVTHRGLSYGVTVLTGRSRAGVEINFRQFAIQGVTLIVLMGVERRAQIARELIDGGLAPTTPVAVIENASTSSQRVTRSALVRLGELNVCSPAVIVVGAVAALEMTEIENVAAAHAWCST